MRHGIAIMVCAGFLLGGVQIGRAYGASSTSADYWVGVDKWWGHMTYEIGGTVKMDDMVEQIHFPLSRLEWPISLVSVQVGGRLAWNNWDARAAFSAGQNDDAGTMKNSDWEIPDAPKVLTTYSESDTELEMWQVDASLRYWFAFQTSNPKEQARLGGGVGVLYQDFDWSARDAEQWYPQNPELGIHRLPGVVITYEAQVLMPYVEVGGQLKFQNASFEARLGLAPWAQVEDVDDHKLRYILAETTGEGSGVFGELLARYTLTNNVFLQFAWWGMSLETEGTEKDYVYGGEAEGARWEIDHEVKSSQIRLTLALGVTF